VLDVLWAVIVVVVLAGLLLLFAADAWKAPSVPEKFAWLLVLAAGAAFGAEIAWSAMAILAVAGLLFGFGWWRRRSRSRGEA
jgi:lipoprotein signal peptidase